MLDGAQVGREGGREEGRAKERNATHLVVLLPALGQQSVLHDPDGREKLQGS